MSRRCPAGVPSVSRRCPDDDVDDDYDDDDDGDDDDGDDDDVDDGDDDDDDVDVDDDDDNVWVVSLLLTFLFLEYINPLLLFVVDDNDDFDMDDDEEVFRANRLSISSKKP